jgi:hypothetical protein
LAGCLAEAAGRGERSRTDQNEDQKSGIFGYSAPVVYCSASASAGSNDVSGEASRFVCPVVNWEFRGEVFAICRIAAPHGA